MIAIKVFGLDVFPPPSHFRVYRYHFGKSARNRMPSNSLRHFQYQTSELDMKKLLETIVNVMTQKLITQLYLGSWCCLALGQHERQIDPNVLRHANQKHGANIQIDENVLHPGNVLLQHATAAV